MLWGAEIAVEDPDGSMLVDFTSFVVRDAHDVVGWLDEEEQGTFSLDHQRSAPELHNCLALPDNLEFEATLTFTSKKPGKHVKRTAPTPQAVTVVQHHSLVRLPDDGYRPRKFDPRVGGFSTTFQDYAAPLDQPLVTRWLRRHRLEKTDPAAARSRVREPIVYYMDRGAPGPIRAALMDGAGWWARAFEEAGFIDAFRVELLPEDAHPLDVRYNMINWVHRSTRGWSYGSTVVDPRTGEIIKGHVMLGSLRVRQDRLIFEGLAGTDRTGTGGPDDPVQLALARLRQLSAHEVGHTLGLSHNFAASTYGGRASVMDYPAPLVEIDAGGELDFRNVYGTDVGEWDVFAIRYGYSQFPPEANEVESLAAIMADGLQRGLRFITDADARPAGAAHPLANLWDNGTDPIAALDLARRVRRIALERFGPHNVAVGRPIAQLREVLVPVYLYHRYQLAAAAKSIGGLHYRYALRDDGQPPSHPVDGATQRRALEAVLQCLDPREMDLPDDLLDLLHVGAYGAGTHGTPENDERLAGKTAPAFDTLSAAETLADMVVGAILQPQRCARLVDFNRRDADLPGLEEVLTALTDRVFDDERRPDRRLAEVQRVVQHVVVNGLIDLALGAEAASVRARVDAHLGRLRDELAGRPTEDAGASAHHELLVGQIVRYLDRRWDAPRSPSRPAPAPPGSPIGAGVDDDGCSFWAVRGP